MRTFKAYRKHLRPKDRRGAAVVEFAFVCPFLILLIVGMIEFGRAVMVQQLLTNASREGARRAIIESATTAEVTTLVNDYLAGSTISGASVTVSPSPLASAGLGDPINVSVSVPFDQITWIAPWFMGGRTLTATSIMRADRFQ